MLGTARPEQLGRAAYDAVRQVDPQEYYRHTQPGVDGTDPFGALSQGERGGLIGTLLTNLLSRGVGQNDIQRGAGLSTLDPSRMTASDLAALAQWAQQNFPQVFGYTAAEYKDQPNILSSLLGNKALMMAVAGIGTKLLMDRMNEQR
jgi:hypothetical protein